MSFVYSYLLHNTIPIGTLRCAMGGGVPVIVYNQLGGLDAP